MKDVAWLDERDALVLHDRLLALHGGVSGVRDSDLLASALARPRQYFSYAEDPSIIHMAALYTAAIVPNHPFADGNKRTGFVMGILFLELNGYAFMASEEASAQAVIALAAGTMDESGYAAFISDNLC
ncbi:MAG TPA: type II toxin-antitoxin system death-on-curing family toxin [Rhizomicrobium sp.]|jgi:death-on-curing protein